MYRHPIFDRPEWSGYCAVLDLEKVKAGENGFVLSQGNADLPAEFLSHEEFMERLRKSNDLRVALGIPCMAYHAYSFPRLGYDAQHVRNLVEWARGHDLEVRVWVNPQSALLLVVIADPDTSVDSGWDLYQYVKKNAGSYEALGLSSWYEFCAFGVPVPPDWELVERGDMLCAMSPKGDQVVTFG